MPCESGRANFESGMRDRGLRATFPSCPCIPINPKKSCARSHYSHGRPVKTSPMYFFLFAVLYVSGLSVRICFMDFGLGCCCNHSFVLMGQGQIRTRLDKHLRSPTAGSLHVQRKKLGCLVHPGRSFTCTLHPASLAAAARLDSQRVKLKSIFSEPTA